MEHRLIQPASRDQIVAIIRQRAERAANREMLGAPGAAPVRPVGPVVVGNFEQAWFDRDIRVMGAPVIITFIFFFSFHTVLNL